MVNRSICLFINLFVCLFAKSQQVYTGLPYAKYDIVNDTTRQPLTNRALVTNLTSNPFKNSSIKTVPAAFYYNSIGFFCQKELQLEKTLKFPVKLRLGSVDYTDQMEGKGRESFILHKGK